MDTVKEVPMASGGSTLKMTFAVLASDRWCSPAVRQTGNSRFAGSGIRPGFTWNIPIFRTLCWRRERDWNPTFSTC